MRDANETKDWPHEIQVATYSRDNPVGTSRLERFTGDEMILAFLMDFDEAVTAGVKDLTPWVNAAKTARFHVKYFPTEGAKLAMAYQQRETQEAEASRLGHSVIMKGRELTAIHHFLVTKGGKGNAANIAEFLNKDHTIVYSNSGNPMNEKNIQV